MAFTFPDNGEVSMVKSTENVASTANANVCDNQVYEYFYTSSNRFKVYCDSVYGLIFNETNRPARKVFEMAMKGYAFYFSQGVIVKRNIMTFIDYSLSSNAKRLWVIDLNKMKVMFHELVAHGRNSGEEFARKFSNKGNSFQSSLGFYLTGEIYNGKHDKSVRMIGLEKRFNGNALDRGIVMHGADYVSEDYIQKNKRLGRSLGCMAVSQDIISDISDVIADGSLVFAYHPNKSYQKSSNVNRVNVLFSQVLINR